MTTGWRCNNRLHNVLLCYPLFWQPRASVIKMEPDIGGTWGHLAFWGSFFCAQTVNH